MHLCSSLTSFFVAFFDAIMDKLFRWAVLYSTLLCERHCGERVDVQLYGDHDSGPESNKSTMISASH